MPAGNVPHRRQFGSRGQPTAGDQAAQLLGDLAIDRLRCAGLDDKLV
jgi:hypothetical protein